MCVCVGGGEILAVRHLFLLLVVFGPATVVRAVLRYWIVLKYICRGWMAHGPGGLYDSSFADSRGSPVRGLTVHGPQYTGLLAR